MTFISQAEQDNDIEPFDVDPWAQQLDLQWEKRFEQREPSTEDKVIQVDVGNQVIEGKSCTKSVCFKIKS